MEYYTDGILKYYIHSGRDLACCGYASGNNKPSNISIPEMVMGHKVTLISGQAFQNEPDLKNVEFTQSIECIAANAFSNCKKLQKITITKTGIARLPLKLQKFAIDKCPQLIGIMGLKRKTYLETYSITNCVSLNTLNLSIIKAQNLSITNCPNLNWCMIGNGAFIESDSFKLSEIKTISFEGNIARPDMVLSWLKKDVKVLCLPNANLADLIYDGYIVETK